MQPDESVARIKNEIELNIYSMVRKSKRDVESINIYVKKRYNYLENQLASTQKKIDLFNGLSLFFKRLSDRKSSIPLDDNLFDREVAKILERLFCSSSNNMNITSFPELIVTNRNSEYFQRFSDYSKQYACYLEEINLKILALKELRAFSKYFSELFEKEKLFRKQEQKCLILIKEFEDNSPNYDLKKEIESSFNEYKTVYLSDYNLKIASFDKNTYYHLIEIFIGLEHEASKIFHELINSFFSNILIKHFTEKVNHLKATLKETKKLLIEEKNFTDLAAFYECITNDHKHNFPSINSQDDFFEEVLKSKDKISLDSTIELFEKE